MLTQSTRTRARAPLQCCVAQSGRNAQTFLYGFHANVQLGKVGLICERTRARARGTRACARVHLCKLFPFESDMRGGGAWFAAVSHPQSPAHVRIRMKAAFSGNSAFRCCCCCCCCVHSVWFDDDVCRNWNCFRFVLIWHVWHVAIMFCTPHPPANMRQLHIPPTPRNSHQQSY